MKWLAETVVDDILLPAAMAFIFYLTEMGDGEFFDLAFFLCSCEILSTIWINRCTYILLKEVRQISSSFLIPLPALVLLSIVFPDLDIQEIAVIIFHYVAYMFYSLLMIFLRPTIHLILFGADVPYNDGRINDD